MKPIMQNKYNSLALRNFRLGLSTDTDFWILGESVKKYKKKRKTVRKKHMKYFHLTAIDDSVLL